MPRTTRACRRGSLHASRIVVGARALGAPRSRSNRGLRVHSPPQVDCERVMQARRTIRWCSRRRAFDDLPFAAIRCANPQPQTANVRFHRHAIRATSSSLPHGHHRPYGRATARHVCGAYGRPSHDERLQRHCTCHAVIAPPPAIGSGCARSSRARRGASHPPGPEQRAIRPSSQCRFLGVLAPTAACSSCRFEHAAHPCGSRRRRSRTTPERRIGVRFVARVDDGPVECSLQRHLHMHIIGALAQLVAGRLTALADARAEPV